MKRFTIKVTNTHSAIIDILAETQLEAIEALDVWSENESNFWLLNQWLEKGDEGHSLDVIGVADVDNVDYVPCDIDASKVLARKTSPVMENKSENQEGGIDNGEESPCETQEDSGKEAD